MRLVITLSAFAFALAGCAGGEKGGCPFGFDRLGKPAEVTAGAVPAGASASSPARKVPGAELAEMVLNFARGGQAEALSEYFAAEYTADFANAKGDTPLILAAYHGHADALRVILAQSDAAVNRLNGMGFTALTGASFKGDVAAMRMLIAAGADVNAAGPTGKTPLMFAALTNREAAVELLLANGADPAARAADGSTAATLARGQGSEALAARLAKGRP